MSSLTVGGSMTVGQTINVLKVTGITTPILDVDAVNKYYVDNQNFQMLNMRQQGFSQNFTANTFGVLTLNHSVISLGNSLGSITWSTDHFSCPVAGLYRVTVSIPFSSTFSGLISVQTGDNVFIGSQTSNQILAGGTSNCISFSCILPTFSEPPDTSSNIYVFIKPNINISTQMVSDGNNGSTMYPSIMIEFITARSFSYLVDG